jgi:hypothetical protein
MTDTLLQMIAKSCDKVENDTEKGETLAKNNEEDKDTGEESDDADEKDVDEVGHIVWGQNVVGISRSLYRVPLNRFKLGRL